ncbi:MAG: hypothetical protein QOI59_6964 [Gammaproteobacteria bacterium]|nr:hypothetical protein [Gammaproteobacteria bacterium]
MKIRLEMLLTVLGGAGLVVTAGHAVRAAEPRVNVSPVVLEGLSSTKDHGVVKVMADPTLAQGRLVLKVVAFNRNTTASTFGPDDVKVFTAAGQSIPLVTLDQLVRETRAAAGAPETSGTRSVDTFGTSGPTMMHDMAGRPDVGNYTAGSNSMGTSVSAHGPPRAAPTKMDDPKLQQQIADLSAAILQPVQVASASAVGGQVVTQTIKFGRKEERSLRVVVAFNGEQHEFTFAAPGER